MPRALPAIIGQNLGLKAIATVAAIGLWFYVMNTEDPIRREVRTPEVTAVNAPSGLAVSRVRPEALRVTLSGRLSGLSNEQLAHLSVVADAAAGREGRNEFPVHVLGVPPRVGVTGMERDTVQVWLERLTTRRVPVSVVCAGDPAEGYALTGPPVSAPEAVEVSGPDSLIRRVARVVAKVDVTGSRSRQALTATVEARDANGETLHEVSLAPEKVQVTVAIAAGESQPVPVHLRLGSAAAGTAITDTRVVPGTVSLRGSVEALEGVTEVSTERLEVGHRSGVREYRVPLRPPQGTWLSEGERTVTVKVTVGSDRTPAAPPRTPEPDVTDDGTANSQTEPGQADGQGASEEPRTSGGEPTHPEPGNTRPAGARPAPPGKADGDAHRTAPPREEVTRPDGRP